MVHFVKITIQDFEKKLAKISRDLRLRLSDGFTGKPISQQKFSDLLGVSWSTVARWEEKRVLPDRKMADKITLLHLMLMVLENKNLVPKADRFKFFHEPNPKLLEMRPIDLLGMRNGEEAIMKVLNRS